MQHLIKSTPIVHQSDNIDFNNKSMSDNSHNGK